MPPPQWRMVCMHRKPHIRKADRVGLVWSVATPDTLLYIQLRCQQDTEYKYFYLFFYFIARKHFTPYLLDRNTHAAIGDTRFSSTLYAQRAKKKRKPHSGFRTVSNRVLNYCSSRTAFSPPKPSSVASVGIGSTYSRIAVGSVHSPSITYLYW